MPVSVRLDFWLKRESGRRFTKECSAANFVAPSGRIFASFPIIGNNPARWFPTIGKMHAICGPKPVADRIAGMNGRGC